MANRKLGKVTQHFLKVLVGCIPFIGAQAFAQFEPIDNRSVKSQPTSLASNPCSTKQISDWQRVVDQSQGIASRDPVNHHIGRMVAVKPDVNNAIPIGENWIPNHGEKQTLCGTVFKFGYFGLNEMDQITDWELLNPRSWVDWIASVDFNSLDEADINVFIEPDPAFAYLVDDVRRHRFDPKKLDGLIDPGGWHDCRHNSFCVEGEITPDEGFYSNPWFKPYKTFNRLDKKACIYGPWVREKVHGNRPEIHPMETMWWREGDHLNGPYVMMQMQDDSNRFDRFKDFRHKEIEGPHIAESEEAYKERLQAIQSDFKPWSAAPITSEFRIAFGKKKSTLPLIYWLDSRVHFKVLDAEDGSMEHRFKSRTSGSGLGRQIDQLDASIPRASPLTVIETSRDNVDRLDVDFVDTCFRPDGYFQGFISIKSEAGDTDRGGRFGEGVHVIEAWGEHSYSRTKRVQVSFNNISLFHPSADAEFDGKTVTFKVNETSHSIELTGGTQTLNIVLSTDISDTSPLDIEISSLLPGWKLEDDEVLADRVSHIKVSNPRSRNFRAGDHTWKSISPSNKKAAMPTVISVDAKISVFRTGGPPGQAPSQHNSADDMIR